MGGPLWPCMRICCVECLDMLIAEGSCLHKPLGARSGRGMWHFWGGHSVLALR